MPSRADTAAATRRALLDSAAALLESGGPEVVTLREVGARAGVSRSAAYRHFADKDDLIAEVAAEAWDRLGAELSAVAPRSRPLTRVRAALHLMLALGHEHPHLYRAMLIANTETSTIARAATRTQEVYVALVAEVVGDAEAWHYAGLMLATVHGLSALGASGHMIEGKWPPPAELIDLLVRSLPAATRG